MECRITKIQLSRYQDGELSAVEASQVKEHLQSCSSCAAYCRETSDIVTGIRSLESSPVSARFKARVMSEIREKQSPLPAGRTSRWITWVYTLVFVLFLSFGMVFIEIEPRPQKRTEVPASVNRYIDQALRSEQSIGLLDIQENIIGMIEAEVKR